MFWEKKLGDWVNSIKERSALPLRLELWNGQQLDFGQHAPQVTVRVPHASALSYLLTPSL
ncbi:MAG: cyclopropane-fatty-acyl-phospholipid synthase, partial [Burkholderiales bacterium]